MTDTEDPVCVDQCLLLRPDGRESLHPRGDSRVCERPEGAVCVRGTSGGRRLS